MRKILLMVFACCAVAAQAQRMADLSQARFVSWDAMKQQVVYVPLAPPLKAEGLSSLQRPVGYIVDNQPDSITVSGALLGSIGSFQVGALITADMLRPYVGCKVIGIRMAAAQSLGKTQLFLHPLRDGYISDDGITKSQRLYEGWNNVFFNGDTSWEITEDEAILVGFDYSETENMVQTQVGGLCTVGEAQGYDFLLYGNMGSGEGWYAIHDLGALCVQLIVDVSSLPEKSLSITYLDAGFRYKQRGEMVELYVVATNTGRENVADYTISCQLDDNAPIDFHYAIPLPEMASDHQQPVLSLPDDIMVGEHRLKVMLLAEEDTQIATGQAERTVDFYIYEQMMPRQKAYVEQYNSQNEYMASVVNPFFNQVAKSNEDMVLVNVYDPESSLNVPESDALFDLYAYTIPSFTINRAYFPGEEYVAYDVNYYAEQYGAIVPSILDDMVAQDMLSPAFATLNLTPVYDAEMRQLNVEVTGTMVDKALDIFNNLSVTLLLTEDNVVAPQVVKNPVTQKKTVQADYVHQHVLRTYITSPFGNPVDVDGASFSSHHSVYLDPSWNLDNMTLVGFLTRGIQATTDEQILNMDVTNCNALPLNGISGIRTLGTETEGAPQQLFNVVGTMIPPSMANPGIYILRKGNLSRKIIIRK